MTILNLTEHITRRFEADVLSVTQGEHLLTRFGKYVDVEFPTPRTGGKWELTPKGWIGAFAVDADLTVVSSPKVPIGNLGWMLASVYGLDIEDFPGLVNCSTLTELYEHVALALATRVLVLARQGLHASYVPTANERTSIRGRILFDRHHISPKTRLRCLSSERTHDVLLNQIPLWALDRVLRSQLCAGNTHSTVRKAYRQLIGSTSVQPVRSEACLSVAFDRLTERYRAVVALSRLIIDGIAPTAATGGSGASPFLIHMPRLFERFVCQWLARACNAQNSGLRVEGQERTTVGDDASIDFTIDIVMYEERTGRAVCVLDTKYKDADRPSSNDVAQIGYYALLKRTRAASLIYPRLVPDWRATSGDVNMFSSSFDLSRDLRISGEQFLESLMLRITPAQVQGPVPTAR